MHVLRRDVAERDVDGRRRLLVPERFGAGVPGRADAEGRVDHGHMGVVGRPRGVRGGGECGRLVGGVGDELGRVRRDRSAHHQAGPARIQAGGVHLLLAF